MPRMKRWLLALLVIALVAIVWRAEPWGDRDREQEESQARKATRLERSMDRDAERRRRVAAAEPEEKERLARMMAALEVRGGMEVDWDPQPALQAVDKLSLDSIRTLVDKVEEQMASGEMRAGRNVWWSIFTAGIWERYSVLAPAEAMERAFARPPRAPTADGGTEDMLVRTAALRGAASSDPERVRAFVLDPPAGTDLSRLWNWESIFERLAGHSTEGLLDVVQALPRSTGEEVYRVYAKALGEGTDWAREGEMLLEWRQREKLTTPALVPELASTWARYDPEKALEWVSGGSDSLGKQEVVATINLWTTRDPASAAAWLKTWQPETVSKGDVLSGVLRQAAGQNAEQTEALLGLVEDAEERNIGVILKMKKAPEDAEFDPEALEFMASSPLLSPRAQEVVREKIAEIEAGEGG